ncbi:MAG: amidohydrolase family protein [Proteobacteria bacterium]|nr:amidohydrolase family protein [Pseudomonadota bacterium]MBU1742626.1 amidohydrolase family protein [Pseudomonadota bacterium]
MVDVHVHVFPAKVVAHRERFLKGEPAFEAIYADPDSRLVTAEQLVAAMDEQGVRTSVVMGFPWQQQANLDRHNQTILEAQQRHPGRIIGLGLVNPARGDAAVQAKALLDAGLAGLGELAWYARDIDQEVRRQLGPLATVCAEAGKPLLLHTNESVGHVYPGKAPMTLGALYQLLKNHPRTTWILAHWGGGLFFYALMKKEVDEVFQNVYFDTAASPFLYRPLIYAEACRIVGPDKVLFGSDYPLIEPGRYFREISDAGLTDAQAELILGRNARTIFRV